VSIRNRLLDAAIKRIVSGQDYHEYEALQQAGRNRPELVRQLQNKIDKKIEPYWSLRQYVADRRLIYAFGTWLWRNRYPPEYKIRKMQIYLLTSLKTRSNHG